MSSKCSCLFTRGEGGVKKVQNPVHVVCERPLTYYSIAIDVDEVVDPKESLDKIEEGNIKLQRGNSYCVFFLLSS